MTKRVLVTTGLIAAAFSIFVVGRLLAQHDFNPTTTIKFGEQLPEQNEYAEALLGEIVLAPMAGHDGKYFFVQAMDPLYLEPDVHAVYLDRPSYRAQRMAYPTVASMGGFLSAEGTAWGLIAVNVVAMVLGTVYTGLTAVRMGATPWLGLAFFLNPGLIVDLTIDGAGVVATAAMMAGVYYVLLNRISWAAAALSVAALGRETMLIAVAGLALLILYRKRRVEWRMGIPVAVVAVWWWYVHWRLEGGLAQDTQALGLPFQGFAEAFQGWVGSSDAILDMVVGCFLLGISFTVVVRTLKTPTAVGTSVAGFAVLGLMLSEPVWRNWFDSSRALAPVLTAFILQAVPPVVAGFRPDPARQAAIGTRR